MKRMSFPVVHGFTQETSNVLLLKVREVVRTVLTKNVGTSLSNAEPEFPLNLVILPEKDQYIFLEADIGVLSGNGFRGPSTDDQAKKIATALANPIWKLLDSKLKVVVWVNYSEFRSQSAGSSEYPKEVRTEEYRTVEVIIDRETT